VHTAMTGGGRIQSVDLDVSMSSEDMQAPSGSSSEAPGLDPKQPVANTALSKTRKQTCQN